MPRILRFTLLLPLLIVLGACGGSEPQGGSDSASNDAERSGPFTILATIGMVSDVVSNVAGDRAEVEVLMGPGIDPHLYSPTRSDVQRLIDADIVFCNGLYLEARMTDALFRAGRSGIPVHPVTELLDDDFLLEPEDFGGLVDPHVWNDPAAWAQTIDAVRDALIEFDPAGADDYRSNAEAYAAQIAALEEYATTVLASVPERSRVLVTAHDAFNYFGGRFGYEVVGVQGVSTESEAGLRDIERLVDMLVERDVKAVFVETTVNDRNVQALIDGARARGHEVVIGGELFSDAMGDEGTYEGTYIGMIDHNTTVIARALGGSAPEGG
ncbi:MAG: zinc ABC transporter substrate-binding protein, partial [Planctomycetota bacterium]